MITFRRSIIRQRAPRLGAGQQVAPGLVRVAWSGRVRRSCITAQGVGA